MRNRCVTSKALVWSCYVIILFDELSKQPFKVILAKHDHMVKQLSPQGSNESLHIGILPRTSWGGWCVLSEVTRFRFNACFYAPEH